MLEFFKLKVVQLYSSYLVKDLLIGLLKTRGDLCAC